MIYLILVFALYVVPMRINDKFNAHYEPKPVKLTVRDRWLIFCPVVNLITSLIILITLVIVGFYRFKAWISKKYNQLKEWKRPKPKKIKLDVYKVKFVRWVLKITKVDPNLFSTHSVKIPERRTWSSNVLTVEHIDRITLTEFEKYYEDSKEWVNRCKYDSVHYLIKECENNNLIEVITEQKHDDTNNPPFLETRTRMYVINPKEFKRS